MSDNMAEIIALGCGLVGKFVISKLASHGIPIHTVDLVVPDVIKQNPHVTFQEGDVHNILPDLPKAKIVLNLLPGNIGEQIRLELIKMGKHVIDLAFTDSEPSIHHHTAILHKSRVIWDVGIAPGLSNMIIKKEYQQDKNIESITIKVGGNPARPDSVWSYMAPFSPSDVIEEYTRPARIVSDGQITTVDALTDLHKIKVEGYGEMEAFLTDGLRSLLNTNIAPNMREYTVRWPGHIQKWLSERDRLSESDLIEAWKFDTSKDEFTWMEIKITGKEESIVWKVVDSGMDGHSSMARTTGLVTVACTLELLEMYNTHPEGVKSGVYAPEDLSVESIERVIKYLRDESVSVERELIV